MYQKMNNFVLWDMREHYAWENNEGNEQYQRKGSIEDKSCWQNVSIAECKRVTNVERPFCFWYVRESYDRLSYWILAPNFRTVPKMEDFLKIKISYPCSKIFLNRTIQRFSLKQKVIRLTYILPVIIVNIIMIFNIYLCHGFINTIAIIIKFLWFCSNWYQLWLHRNMEDSVS